MPDYRLAARKAARKYGLNESIFLAMINQESGFRMNVGSSAGARDIAQFIPSTAKAYGVTLGDNRASDDLDGAARYMRDNLKKYGSYSRALSAYNSGRPDAYKDPGFAKGQTYNYVKNILAAAGKGDPGAGGVKSGGGSDGGSDSSTKTTPSTTRTVTTPGVDRKAERAALFLNYLHSGGSDRPGAFLDLATGLTASKDTPPSSKTITVPGTTTKSDSTNSTPSSSGGSADTTAKGTINFEGKKVAAWIAPALVYARKHGWTGKVNSGYRSFEDQTRIYNSGVRPAAKPGTSNHEGAEFPRGAVDVSNPEQLAKILAHSPYAGKLVYAGAKDPVHFSHPHGGSY